MLHVETDLPRARLRHVFLEGATMLRPDLTDE
jgi:chorismate mutase